MLDAKKVFGWSERLGELTERLAPRFPRKDLRGRAEAYLRGLLGQADRKNSWQLADSMGVATPHSFQRLLGRARWNADGVRDDLVRYVAEHLGEDDGVLTFDETGFLKKGDKSAGVARQYSGTAGRIENCQIGVFAAYRSSRGHALIDRALYRWAYRPFEHLTEGGCQKGFLVRQSLSDPTEQAYYLTHCPKGTPLQKLVEVAGSRWAIEECFQQAKGQTGLDEYEVRTWDGWCRHITLSMFAHASLVVLRSEANRPSKKRATSPS